MKNTKQAGSSAATSSKPSGGGKGQRRKFVDSYAHNQKENVDPIFAAEVATRTSDSKSPLPIGYPRIPLQDITDVLQALDNIPGEEDGNNPGKPNTRSKGLRKTEIVKTTILTEKTVKKTVSKASSIVSETRQRKAVVDVVLQDNSVQGGERAQMKEALRLTASLASSIQLKQPLNQSKASRIEKSSREELAIGEAAETSREEFLIKNTSDSAREEIPDEKAVQLGEIDVDRARRGEMVDPMEGNARPASAETQGRDRAREGFGQENATSSSSTSGARIEDSREQKRRKPLSARSSVSRFR